MYVDFYEKLETGRTIEDVLNLHKEALLVVDPNTTIEFVPTVRRNDATVLLCIATSSGCSTIECTGFINFANFVFICVLITPENRQRQNIRKLENVLMSAYRMNVTNS